MRKVNPAILTLTFWVVHLISLGTLKFEYFAQYAFISAIIVAVIVWWQDKNYRGMLKTLGDKE